jgi:hypothetical protein
MKSSLVIMMVSMFSGLNLSAPLKSNVSAGASVNFGSTGLDLANEPKNQHLTEAVRTAFVGQSFRKNFIAGIMPGLDKRGYRSLDRGIINSPELDHGKLCFPGDINY